MDRILLLLTIRPSTSIPPMPPFELLLCSSLVIAADDDDDYADDHAPAVSLFVFATTS